MEIINEQLFVGVPPESLIGFKSGLCVGHSSAFAELSWGRICIFLDCLGHFPVGRPITIQFWGLEQYRISLYFAPFIFSSLLTSLLVSTAENTPKACFTMVLVRWMVHYFLYTWHFAIIWLLYHKGLSGGELQRWLPFWKNLSSPLQNSGALTEWPLGSWSCPKSVFLNAQSRKSPGNSKQNIRVMEATAFFGTFNAQVIFVCTLH